MLADGKEVSNGDGEHDERVADGAPFIDEVAKHFVEDGHQYECACPFGNNGEIGGYRSGSTLVNVRRPEVERHQGDFEE